MAELPTKPVPTVVLDDTLDFFGLMVRLYTEQKSKDRQELIRQDPAFAGTLESGSGSYELYLKPFVDFCRERLREVPPVGTYPAGEGLGLRFADSTSVPFMTQTAAQQPVRDSMPISRPTSGGVSDMQDTTSMSISKGKIDYGRGDY